MYIHTHIFIYIRIYNWMEKSLQANALLGRPHARSCWTVPDYAWFTSPAPNRRTLVPSGRPHHLAYLMPVAAPGIVPQHLSHPSLQDS